MIGGVLFILFLPQFFILPVLFVWGDQYLPTKNVKYGIVVSENRQGDGVAQRDKIISVDGMRLKILNRIVSVIILNNAKTIEVKTERRAGKLSQSKVK